MAKPKAKPAKPQNKKSKGQKVDNSTTSTKQHKEPNTQDRPPGEDASGTVTPPVTTTKGLLGLYMKKLDKGLKEYYGWLETGPLRCTKLTVLRGSNEIRVEIGSGWCSHLTKLVKLMKAT